MREGRRRGWPVRAAKRWEAYRTTEVANVSRLGHGRFIQVRLTLHFCRQRSALPRDQTRMASRSNGHGQAAGAAHGRSDERGVIVLPPAQNGDGRSVLSMKLALPPLVDDNAIIGAGIWCRCVPAGYAQPA